MRQAAGDRRSRRTRQLLMQAMVELIRVKRYDAISVREITEHADVGRSTFYAHFTDKDDLFVDGVHRMIDGLDPAPGHPQAAWPYPSLALLHHVGSQADLYRILARGRGLALFLTGVQDALTAKATDRLMARLPAATTPAVPAPLLAAMTTSMLITAVRDWVDSGLVEPAEAVDRTFRVAAEAAIRAGLRPLD